MTLPKDPVKRAATIQKLKDAALKRHQDPEYRKKYIESRKDIYKDPEWIRKNKEAAQKRSQDPAWRKKISESAIERNKDPEFKDKFRESMKTRSQNPEYIRNQKEGVEKRSNNQEWKDNISKAAIERFQDPEYQKKFKEAMEKRSQNEEWIKNNSESHKGIQLSDETKEKIRLSNVGKHCGELNPNYGKPAWNRGAVLSDDHKRKIGESNKDKVRTEEFKQHLSEINSGENNPFFGKHHDPEKFMGEKNGMFGKQRSEEAKLATSLANKGKRLGPDNPSWNGGITPLRKAIRESSDMYVWKQKVMERDEFKDVDTGEHGDLEVHHIKSFEDILRDNNIQTLEDARNCKELWNIDNGKTMLKRNHRKYHGLVGEDEGE